MFKNAARQYLEIEIHSKVIVRIVFSGLLLGVYAIIIKSFILFSYLNLILIAVTSLVIYSLALLITGEINKREILAIKSFISTAVS